MKPPCRSLLSLVVAALLGAAIALPAGAEGRHDHDRARQALEEGEILPLPTILRRVESDTPGQIMSVELDHDDQQWLYRIKVLRKDGSLVKLKVNARDGTLVERHDHGDRREHSHEGER